MKFFTEISLVVIIALCRPSFGADVCLANFCIRKCCPMEEIFNSTTSHCQPKVTVSGKTQSSTSKFSLCPGGEWLQEKSTWSDVQYECAEQVVDGLELVQKVLRCPIERQVTAVKIPLTKCCVGPHTYYDIGNQKCLETDENQPVNWPPPVHSLTSNQIVNHSAQDFHITHRLTECPLGYIAQSSIDFTLFEDGSVKIPNIVPKFQPGEVCIANSLPSGGFVTRFCVRDPCTASHCVRKCCPRGFLMNSESKSCEPTSVEFVVEYRDESGQIVSPPNNLVVRGGVSPSCPSGINLLNPEAYHQDEFYILPSGKLYVAAYPETDRVIDEYCAEDFKVDANIERKALICFADQSETPPEVQLVLTIFPYLMFISSIFLIATFVVYAIIPEIRNIHGVTIMCHVASLATTYICLGIIQLDPTLPKSACIGLAIIVHFSFLASFMWLNVMSFDIWITFSDLRPRSSQSRHRIGRRFFFYSLYAWGVPMVIVSIGQILDNVSDLPAGVLRPQFGIMKCWFSDKLSMMAYLYGPIAAILLSNIIFFVLTAVRLHRARMDTAFATKNRQNKQNYIVIFSLFVLMGVTWVTEVITAVVEDGIYYSIPTDVLNILTGVFIFIIFVCKRKVRRLLRQKMKPIERAIKRKKQSSYISTAPDTSSSSNTTKSQRTSRKTSITAMTGSSSMEMANALSNSPAPVSI